MDPRPFPTPSTSTTQPPAARRKTMVLIAGGLVLGALLGYLSGAALRQLTGDAAGNPLQQYVHVDRWTLIALPLIWMICVLVHELGHLLGGRLAGMRPLLLFAGPLHLDFGADRLRMRWNRVASTWGGLAACAPGERSGRGQFGALVAGGPLASIALTALCAIVVVLAGGWLGGFAFALGALSLLIGIVTLVPLRAGGFTSDGGQLLGLWRNDASTRERLALAALMAQSHAGTRPRDWDGALLATLGQSSDDPTLQAVLISLRASRAQDAGDWSSADTHWRTLAELLSGAGGATLAPSVRRGLGLPVAGWLGQHRGDAQGAQAWLDASRGGMSDSAVRAYVEATVLFAQQRRTQARAALATARSALAQTSDRGSAIALADWLDLLQRQLDDDVRSADSGAAQT